MSNHQQRGFHGPTFLFRKDAKLLAHLGRVCDYAGEPIAYIHSRKHPLLGCLAVVLGIATFFAFPVSVEWLVHFMTKRMGAVNPLGIDNRQPIAIVIALWILIVVLGFLLAMFTCSLARPRWRISVFEDESRRRPLLFLNERWSVQFNSVSYNVHDSERKLGQLRWHYVHEQCELFDVDGGRIFVACKEGSRPGDWTKTAGLAVIAMIIEFASYIFNLIWVKITLPKSVENYDLWQCGDQTGNCSAKIGMIQVDLAALFPYQLTIGEDATGSAERRLLQMAIGIVFLMRPLVFDA